MNRRHKIIPGIFYHVYNRGNDRQFLFRDDSDYLHAVRALLRGLESNQVSLGAYCLMPNHYHLILRQAKAGSISRLMHSWCTSIAKRRNLKYYAVGHVFQDKFKASPLLSPLQVVEKCKYIHLNPVKARIVRFPDQWRWSNYSSFVGTGQGGSPMSPRMNSSSTQSIADGILIVIGGCEGYRAFVSGEKLAATSVNV